MSTCHAKHDISFLTLSSLATIEKVRVQIFQSGGVFKEELVSSQDITAASLTVRHRQQAAPHNLSVLASTTLLFKLPGVVRGDANLSFFTVDTGSVNVAFNQGTLGHISNTTLTSYLLL